MKLKLLDLFSGLGGFSLGLERTGCFKTVAFCEIDKYCTLILNKHWKGIKVYDDVRKITKEQFDADGIEYPDIITGGFPCQPFSVAGKQKGTGDDRHLWPEMFRIIKAFRPRIVIGENVKGIINIQDGLVFETVCTDLENEGYEVQAFNIPAAGVQAPHRRERIWIIATNVANPISDDERREITRSYETRDDKEGRTRPANLREQVDPGRANRSNNKGIWQRVRTTVPKKLWPTPTTQEIEHPNMKLTKTGRRLTKDGKDSHSLNLADTVRMWPTPTQDCVTERKKKYSQGGKPLTLAVQEEELRMWPTPRACDLEGGIVKNVELRNGSFSRVNKKGVRFGVKLKDAVHKIEQMWPTPRAALGMSFKLTQGMANLRHKKYLETEVAYVEKAPGGTLNPMWVEWLMGYPAGYTDLKDWEILSSPKSRKKSVKQS
jgi:DNA-cytosine methyltransferase